MHDTNSGGLSEGVGDRKVKSASVGSAAVSSLAYQMLTYYQIDVPVEIVIPATSLIGGIFGWFTRS